ncbi:MAG: methyltransferase domain-containing protein [Rikenellaceae bacterium]|nr:methyltransferase domain-containing protein [Rikenellaceae bacterium]
MKVGTDGVLLGAWVPLRPEDRLLLDLGTGCGVIALMLAQRQADARITALDIDPDCVEQTRENAERSPWGGRITAVEAPVQEFFPPEPFDLIVSNPPYFENSLLSPDAGRSRARHTASLSFAELLQAADRLLTPEGRLAVVLPTEEAKRFRLLASQRFWLEARLDVRTTPRRPVKRSLMLFGRRQPAHEPAIEELVIQTAPETFTPEYRALTGDFYLKF